VVAKYWDSHWTMKSDYKIGMDHWDAEVVIPVKSMRIRSPNAPGQAWRFLACRDWKYVAGRWNIYSSLTGGGGFPYPESYGGLVLDDRAPVVQLLSLNDLWAGRFGLTARLYNSTDRPITCIAAARVLRKDRVHSGRTVDWAKRQNPIHAVSKTLALRPGEAVTWTIPAKALPPLDVAKDKHNWYDMAFTVTGRDGSTVYYRAQRHFKKLAYKTKERPYSLPMRVAYNPVCSLNPLDFRLLLFTKQ